MKKIILTTLAAGCLTFSAFSQGSIYIGTGGLAVNNAGVTTFGVNAQNTATASQWFTGNLTWQLWYAPSGSVNPSQLTAINAFNNVANGASSALQLLSGDGFTQIAGGAAPCSDGGFTATNNSSGQINLPTVPTSTSAFLALVLTDTSAGAMNGWEGVLAFANGTGGNPTATPPGLPTNLTGWDALNVNLVMSSVPEPATMVLVGLGGLALVAFRRRS